jgi:hypothetical protein
MLYVDDVYLIGNPIKKIQWIKLENKRRFEMTDLELLNHFLGLEYGFQLDGIIMIQWGMQPKCLKNLG